MQYKQDFDERHPVAQQDNEVPREIDRPWGIYTREWKGWNHSIYPYVKSHQVFLCPSSGKGVDTNNARATNGWRVARQTTP